MQRETGTQNETGMQPMLQLKQNESGGAPLGKIAVLGTCGFFELDESLVGQDQDILDFFCSSVPEK